MAEEVPILEEKGETIDIINFQPIKIEQNEINYLLNIETKEDEITFSINDKEQLPSINYIRKMNLKEIKELNNVFNVLTSFNDFYDYLKSLSINHTLNIKKEKDKIKIIFFVEILLKKQKIEIDLYQTKNDINLNIKEIFQELLNIKNNMKEIDNLKNENNEIKIKLNELNNEMNIIKNENQNLNNEINNLKEENNKMKLKIEEYNKEINNIKYKLFDFKSEIIKCDERDMIFSEIENKMNKKIKEIKKLYQATKDGGEPINFHSKCDNIPNTLVLIKSEGKRRFGGFTPIPWKSIEGNNWIKDPENKTFVFSLDNKKIYYLKSINEDAVYHCNKCGPCFGRGYDIGIEGNPLKENRLCTYQKGSYDYKGDSNALSEYDDSNLIIALKALEYEVFQVIFY